MNHGCKLSEVSIRATLELLILILIGTCARAAEADAQNQLGAPAKPRVSQSFRDAIQSVLPRVVKIFGAGGRRGLYAYSTGFLVSAEGHVATVWSHVLDAEEVTVVLNDGRRFRAKVLGAEPPLDLAVLKIQEDNLELAYFDINQATTATPGTRVLAFSNMFQVATGDEPVSVLHGVIAARTMLPTRRGSFDSPYDGQVYVVDAITNNPGAGGGVITTRDGRLLAMIGKELRNSKSNTWVNYAVPISELTAITSQIITGRFEPARRPADQPDNPGRYRPLDFGMIMIPDVVQRTPAYIDSVVPGTVAESAGLRPDDLVIFVNDELIQSCRALRDEFGFLESSDVLRLVIRRGNQLVTVEFVVQKKQPR